jgi:hypothetical protein
LSDTSVIDCGIHGSADRKKDRAVRLAHAELCRERYNDFTVKHFHEQIYATIAASGADR